jgi:hypothetical protein
LLQRHLRPLEGAIHRRIGRLDMDDVHPGVASSRTRFVVLRVRDEICRDREWRFVRRARTGERNGRVAGSSRRDADGKADTPLELGVTPIVLDLLVRDDLP